MLDEVYGASYWDKNLAPRFGEFARQGSGVQIWIGESATHGGGGTPGISNRFASLCKSQRIPTPGFPSTRPIDCALNAVHVRLNVPSPNHVISVCALLQTTTCRRSRLLLPPTTLASSAKTSAARRTG